MHSCSFLQETVMRLKTLVAVAVAAAFAVPPSTQAQSDKASSGTSAGAPAAPSAGGSAMDKNKDGSISREEAKGTPYEKDFSKLDKDGDGKLSASEQEAARPGGGRRHERKPGAEEAVAQSSCLQKPRFSAGLFISSVPAPRCGRLLTTSARTNAKGRRFPPRRIGSQHSW